ncbi:GIY-YIG nuclease family protein [Gaiella sp.]|uniref:GIY-YIG nuclease family protein n=1 Tax=Gaiella sp. TaxID=2663207 RepID=UPI002E366449|nr:GIY-YIG nuclease family protein [Gaiella sp.]HEX5585298.1 GIY-YIG nuclease family protein [Gaiella sp.]
MANRSAPDGPGAREGYVYFIQEWPCEDGPIKIGFSGDVGERLRVLRSKTRLDLHVIGWFPATLSVERDLHKRFSAIRLHGEWFEATPELLGVVELVRALHNEAGK